MITMLTQFYLHNKITVMSTNLSFCQVLSVHVYHIYNANTIFKISITLCILTYDNPIC